MLPVSWTLGEFRAYNGDDARQRIAQVVDGIHHDGHTAGKNAYSGLESRQQYISYNTNPTGTDDFLTSVHVTVSLLVSSPDSKELSTNPYSTLR